MLVLSRKEGQRIVINDNITIVINRIAGNRVSIGIDAPQEVHIMRGELDKIRREFAEADAGSEPLATPLPISAEFEVDTNVPIA